MISARELYSGFQLASESGGSAVVAYVTIPGIDGSGAGHWQTLWEQQWGAAATRIAPQSWGQPDLDDWVRAIDRAVVDAAVVDRDVALVAHSLGCWAVSRWLNEVGGQHVRGVLLVAPPDQKGDRFPAQDASTFVNVEASLLPCPSLVVASTNDPYCSLDAAERFASDWGSVLHVVDELGHLSTADNLGDWPQGRLLLETVHCR